MKLLRNIIMVPVALATLINGLLYIAPSSVAYAENGKTPTSTSGNLCHNGDLLGFPHWNDYLECTDGAVDLSGMQIGQAITIIALNIVNIGIRLSSLVALGFVIFGGVKYLTSQGDPGKLAAAKDTIIKAIVGMIIAIMAATLVSYVTGQLGAK